MKSRKIIFILTEIILALAAVIIGALLVRGNVSSKKQTISVIMEDSDDESWSGFIYGLRQAALDNDVNLDIISADSISSADAFDKLVSQGKADGAGAFIIEPSLIGDLDESIAELKKTYPVTLVHSTAGTPKDDSIAITDVVSADNYAMGQQLAKEIEEDFGSQLDDKNIGLLMGDSESLADAQRTQGFIDEITNTGALVRWRLNNSSINDANHEILQIQTDVDIIAAMDDYSLRTAAALSSAGYGNAVIYGIGTSERSLYYLDNETVSCIVVPDEFYVGYQAMTRTARILKGQNAADVGREASYKVLTRKNMFEEDNQEMLYYIIK